MSLPASVDTAGLLRGDYGRLRSEVAEALRQVAMIDWHGLVGDLETREGVLTVCERLEDTANQLLDLCDLISRRTSKVE